MPDQNSLPFSRDLLILLLLWCVVVALVNPVGDFPLNDDWAYGQNTRALTVENRLFFSDWPAMTLIAHTLWGTLFGKIFGFSFTVLRFSTLLMGLFGLAGFYQLLQWAALSRRSVWGLVLLLAFNPFWFVLANSYMTDVPFAAMLIWSALFFLKTLEKPALPTLLVATFFALWASFIRQLGLLVPIVFFFLFLYNQLFSKKNNPKEEVSAGILGRNVLWSLLPVTVCFVALEMFTGWLRKTGQLPDAYRGPGFLLQSFVGNKEVFFIAARRTGVTLMTVGLFLLPLGVGFISTFRKLPDSRKLIVWALLLLPSGYCILSAWELFPNGNVFFNLGLGPKLLNDAIWGVNADPKLSDAWFFVVKCAAAVGAVLLIMPLEQVGETTARQRQIRQFSFGFCALYLGFICLHYPLIDRYFLVFVPFILILIGISIKHFTVFGFVLTTFLALFSIAATHDYLAWNRARWQLARQLMEQGIPPEKMDGGFEFNGWHLTGAQSQRLQGLKSWWFVRDDEWVISFGPVWGYDLLTAKPYYRWLPPGPDSVVVNRRKAYTVRDSAWCGMERRSPDSTAYLPEVGGLQPGNGATQSAEMARSGQFSMRLSPAEPFGATLLLDTFQDYDRLTISVWRYPANAEAGIVVAAEDAEKGYFFEPSHIVERDNAGWGRLEMAVTLPASTVGGKGRFYLWNPSSQQTVWFDDLKVYRLQAK